MDKLDPYEILGLSPIAGRREVEISYHRLLSRTGIMQKQERHLIEWAYLILSDPTRRDAFDRSRGYRLHPGLAAGSTHKAMSYFKMGKRAMDCGFWKRAYLNFKKAVLFQPWEPLYRSYLGLTMAHLGINAHRARELCQEALRLDPGNPVCKRHLAAIYEKIGLRKRAKRVLDHRGL